MSELATEEWTEKAAWILYHYSVHQEPEEECQVCKLLKELDKVQSEVMRRETLRITSRRPLENS